MPLKYAIFTGFMVFLTVRMPALVAGLISLLMFIGGHVSSRIEDFYEQFTGFMLYLLKLGYYILPNLSPVFSGTILDRDVNLFENYMSIYWWVTYAVIYTIILLILAVFSFRRKSL